MKYSKTYLQQLSNECIDVEFYKFNNANHKIHTDNITDIDMTWDELPEDIECEWIQADEEHYNRTILANTSISANFADWYGDNNAKVMLIVLE
jgi:hypothetical protein